MSKGSSPQKLIVAWNPALRLWLKVPPNLQDGNLFPQENFAPSVPYSATWPPSGSMRNGLAWQRRRSALPTPASASSSSPGRLLKTPTAQLAVNGGSQHPDKRKAGGHGPTLADEVEHLLPTPTASNPNDGESLESFEARRQRNLAKGINGNGQGTPLGIAVKLLPTPMAGGSKGTRNATASRKTDNPNVNPGWTLTDVVFSGALSNPAAPPADAASPATTPEGSAPAAAAAPTPVSDGPAHLLPTPTARLGDSTSRGADPARYKGPQSMNGRRSNLDDAIAAIEARSPWLAHLLPTPTCSDGERTSCSYGRGNPTLSGALTGPPSDAGSTSSGGPPPGQQTLWDA